MLAACSTNKYGMDDGASNVLGGAVHTAGNTTGVVLVSWSMQSVGDTELMPS